MKITIINLKSVITISALEQVSASLGTLLFIVFGARLLTSLDFGLIAIIWNILQFPIAFFFALVLLPISSSSLSEIQIKNFQNHAFGVLIILLIISVFLMPIIFNLISGDLYYFTFNIWLIIITWLAFQLLFEFIRWNLIRFNQTKSVLISNIIRWLTFFFGIYVLLKFELLTFNSYVLLNFCSLTCWFIYCLIISKHCSFLSTIRVKISLLEIKNNMPLVWSAVTNSSLNYVLIGVLTRSYSIEILAAFQSYKSISNFFGSLSQLVDNHLTAYFARNKIKWELNFLFGIFFIIVIFCTILFGYLASDFISEYFLSGLYSAYSILFMYLLTGSVLQFLMRPIASEIRLSGNLLPFVTSGLIVIFVFIPLILLSGLLQNLYLTIFLSVLSPAAILVPYFAMRVSNFYRG